MLCVLLPRHTNQSTASSSRDPGARQSHKMEYRFYCRAVSHKATVGLPALLHQKDANSLTLQQGVLGRSCHLHPVGLCTPDTWDVAPGPIAEKHDTSGLHNKCRGCLCPQIHCAIHTGFRCPDFPGQITSTFKTCLLEPLSALSLWPLTRGCQQMVKEKAFKEREERPSRSWCHLRYSAHTLG